jgi:tetrahydromethanopterin S-methyltransferase subunit G
MFPFKKKTPEAKPPCPRERVNKRLDETDTRLEEALKEMRRRLAEKEQRKLAVAK